jgi:hypothetical protein
MIKPASINHKDTQTGDTTCLNRPITRGTTLPDTYAITDLISSALANGHYSFFADKPSEAKSMFTQRLYRSLGLAAHPGWARLLVDRYRDLVEVPVPTREDPGGGHHHFAPDDEDAFEYENHHSQDHTH